MVLIGAGELGGRQVLRKHCMSRFVYVMRFVDVVLSGDEDVVMVKKS